MATHCDFKKKNNEFFFIILKKTFILKNSPLWDIQEIDDNCNICWIV
jgi:hypothetical protein